MEYNFFSCFTFFLIIYITAAGGNVTLTLNPATNIEAGNWLFENNVMVFWYPGNFILEGSSPGRVSFNSSSLQLSLCFLQVNDSGRYTLQGAIPPLRAEVALSVQEPITNVSLAVSQTNLVEFNDSVTFTCSAHGTPLEFSWRNRSSELTSGGSVQLSSDGRILTITNLTRYDQGPFTCIVANGISNGTSGTIYLKISYGPSNLTMIVIPKKTGYISGSNITLTCSADSSPPALFLWSNNNVFLNTSGQSLQLTNASQNQTGSYTCIAHNTVTLRYTTTNKTILILDPVSFATVLPSSNQPIFNMSFTLSCDIIGPVDSTYWEKNGLYLHSDSRIFLSNQNKTLTLTQLTLPDDGDYQCVASNSVSNMTSGSYRLMVNYGPWNTSVSGPAIAAVLSSVSLNCCASSQPPSEYTWYFNGSKVAEGTTYMTGALSLNNSGEYTCITYNNITSRSGKATWNLSVIDIISSAMVLPSSNQPIFNMSFILSCDIVGPVDSTYWEKNGLYLHSDSRIFLSNKNKTLTLTQLTLSDDGDYQCVASNSVSNMTSGSYRLIVNYGPWSSTISGPDIAEVGSSVTLNCSAPSRPPCEYTWYFSGSNVAKGPVFETGVLSLNSSGQYTCMAHNNITNRSSSATWNLTVIEGIYSVVVTPSMLIPLASKDLQLFCNITGFYSSIQWLKDGLKFNTTRTATVSMDNTTLAFQPLLIIDDGTYQCAAKNAIGNHVSKSYKLTANYGPMNLMITVEVGNDITLTCDAKSQPQSVYYWIVDNGTDVREGAKIIISMSALGNNYTCVARNPLTNVTLSGVYINSDPSAVVPLQASVLLTTSLVFILAVSML
ncbi:carcinoembryonic antigen-related cell adhesion molecule 1 [Electrophorus electricus]|uniref:carcinoembryonic antigen-related cell adhesion molecule 1 n=1 Tax=Electrophorus electricus TaxID=8005 RepID=UPI0015CF8682|nr:carcinoembryonic antigen-related cell adhesion molecule 1 [Electrophorus electricus]